MFSNFRETGNKHAIESIIIHESSANRKLQLHSGHFMTSFRTIYSQIFLTNRPYLLKSEFDFKNPSAIPKF